jgi:hypothetical protein
MQLPGALRARGEFIAFPTVQLVTQRAGLSQPCPVAPSQVSALGACPEREPKARSRRIALKRSLLRQCPILRTGNAILSRLHGDG